MPNVRSSMLGVALVALVVSMTTAAPSDHGREVSAALRDGDLVAARTALALWIDEVPDNPRLHYNLACLDARLQEPAAAVASLAAAFRLGFDDVRRAEADPDLASLSEREDFLELLGATGNGLADAAALAAIRLPWNRPLPLPLLGPDGRTSDRFSASARVDVEALALTVVLPAGDVVPGPAPWYEGGGVVLTVAVPGPGDTFDSPRAWRFGFGMRDGLATGVVLSHPERVVDQVVLDLAPTLDWDTAAGTRTLNVRLPWSHVAPYAPPADTLFGLNLEVVGQGGRPSAMMTADPASGFPEPRRRRFVPVTVVPGAETPATLQGRVSNTVVGDRPLAIDVTAWFPQAGRSELFTEIQDNAGNSVVTSGETAGEVDIVAGRNEWRRWADLSRLPDGPYRLLATLKLDDGNVLTWGTGLFRFGGSWLPRTRDRVKALPDAEKPAILWRLDLVADALVGRDPRRSPAPVITTVAETDRLLARFADMGTILPPGGALDAYVPDPDGPGHAVTVVTPEGWSPDSPASVVVLDGPADMADELRDRGAFPAEPVLIRLPVTAPGPDSAAIAGNTTAWARALLPGRTVVMVSWNDRIEGGNQAPDTHVKWTEGATAAAAAVRAALDGDQ